MKSLLSKLVDLFNEKEEGQVGSVETKSVVAEKVYLEDEVREAINYADESEMWG